MTNTYEQTKVLLTLSRIQDGRDDYNKIMEQICKNAYEFWVHQSSANHWLIYSSLNQLIDILNLERQGKYHKIANEWADLFSMSFGHALIYQNPHELFKRRFEANHNIKGEKNIVDKYEERWQKYGEITIKKLQEILRLHEDEDYFKKEIKKK